MRTGPSDRNGDAHMDPLPGENGNPVWNIHRAEEGHSSQSVEAPPSYEPEAGYEYEVLLDELGFPVLKDNQFVLKLDSFGQPIIKLDEDGNPIRIKPQPASMAESPFMAGNMGSGPTLAFRLLFLTVSVIMIYAGGKMMLSNALLSASGIGTVVQVRSHLDDVEVRNSGYEQIATYRFTDSSGTVFTGTYGQRLLKDGFLKKGDKVFLKYHPTDPTTNKLDRGPLGLLVLAFGVIILLSVLSSIHRSLN